MYFVFNETEYKTHSGSKNCDVCRKALDVRRKWVQKKKEKRIQRMLLENLFALFRT